MKYIKIIINFVNKEKINLKYQYYGGQNLNNWIKGVKEEILMENKRGNIKNIEFIIKEEVK